MSAENRPHSPHENRPPESGVGPATSPDVELEFQSPSRTEPESELHFQIERTKLQTRVTALERALETSERQRTEIVTQYERLLEERTDEDDATGDETAGLVARLLGCWR
ncbi:hypothetical protein [Natronobacterium gregoryi]|uniref:Uncharacterized protein n=2 Tax=Natronobacterium gregoryi TaxID=44930 RepID=L0AG82_NATGS|nr:hypothetical protein [Natronobacterium gregoryi]AFZ72826.1 hypothetical protein Natgr_1621 [Natronobacterium gregoryi SP2]ELY69410.1 hypothetical protein C490_07799 [Natronobacterium gregoryi SP2]PLK21164.1 hypothetical protein CYV19_05910 [Natronobacterium gregoryi SP2]SFJ09842.1 hypothetical protein SAMN05443661_11413 [Natronobacterium gregoryi]